MLSASQCGARTPLSPLTQTPLSPLTQTTLEKHLPGLPTRRLLQQNRVMKVDVGCVTGLYTRITSNFIFIINLSTAAQCSYSAAY